MKNQHLYFFIEFQFELEQLKTNSEQELLEKEILKTQMKALHSENESSNQKVISLFFHVLNLNLQ